MEWDASLNEDSEFWSTALRRQQSGARTSKSSPAESRPPSKPSRVEARRPGLDPDSNCIRLFFQAAWFPYEDFLARAASAAIDIGHPFAKLGA
jgi:hypothetical protein